MHSFWFIITMEQRRRIRAFSEKILKLWINSPNFLFWCLSAPHELSSFKRRKVCVMGRDNGGNRKTRDPEILRNISSSLVADNNCHTAECKQAFRRGNGDIYEQKWYLCPIDCGWQNRNSLVAMPVSHTICYWPPEALAEPPLSPLYHSSLVFCVNSCLTFVRSAVKMHPCSAPPALNSIACLPITAAECVIYVLIFNWW